MKEAGSKELSKLDNSLITKAMAIEKVDVLYDIRDLLDTTARTYKNIESSLSEIAANMKPYDYFDVLRIPVNEEHEKKRVDFFTDVFKIVILPVPVSFTLWVQDYRVAENRYELFTKESTEIERKCKLIYYSNDAYLGVEEEVRIHVFGRW